MNHADRGRLYLESGDVARELGVVPSTVHALVRGGRLVPVATTPRGVRLFDGDEVKALRDDRARRLLRRSAGRRADPPGDVAIEKAERLT
jgi:hypothetical protein